MSTASVSSILGGLFVSFMSGNSTRMGVSLADGHWHDAGAGSDRAVCDRRSMRQPDRARPRRQSSALDTAGGGVLLAAGVCDVLGFAQVAIAVIVLSMGLENAVFQIDGGAGL